MAFAGANEVKAAEPISTSVGEALQVFPGDKFYFESERIDVPVLGLSREFESRMPGASGFSFRFAIDGRRLRWAREDGRWRYFVAPAGQARAWHGLLGTVLADGDSVGVRIDKQTGVQEWFVDNSIHNRELSARKGFPDRGATTIWSRKIDASKDVAVTVVGTEQVLAEDHRIRGLEYFGIRDQQIRIRYTEIKDSLREEEFLFPISQQMPMLIGVMGLRAKVSEISGTSARIKILRGFDEDDFADPAP